MPPVIPKSRRWSPACEGKSPTGLCSVPRRFLAEFIMIERQGLFPPLRVTSAEPGLALFGDGSRQPGRFSSESGQASVFVVLALGLFLLGAIGGAVDIANLWFHRQAAQTAADAACTAGAMDMLAQAEGSASYSWITGKTSDCKGTTNVAPCQYAALNGYDGSGLIAQTPSNKVALSYPASVSGVTTPPAGLAPTPFLQVNITDRVKVFFLGMLSGNKTMDVGAKAVCGLVQAKSPVPIIGGPTRSIQVNSSNSTCAAATGSTQCNGNGTINLSQGGPNFTGSNFGVVGAPSTAPSNFSGGTTGFWQSSVAAIQDPYALTPAPTVPGLPVAPPGNPSCTSAQIVSGNCHVSYGVDGCPDRTAGCTEYTPGLYTSPIVVKKATAIFVPGIYYLQPTSFDSENGGVPGCTDEAKPKGQSNYDFAVDSNGVVRVATATGDGSHGVMFYLSGPGGKTGYGSAFFGANAGKSSDTIDPYTTSNVYSDCGASAPSGGPALPATLNGNVLLGPCTNKGTYIGSPSTDSTGPVRGLLFFQDRNNGTNGYVQGQPSMQGGGGLLLAGNMYFHNCPSLPCAGYPTNYNAFLQLQGTPGGGTYVLGNITADQLIEAGNGSIYMQQNPNAIYNILKASLLQ